MLGVAVLQGLRQLEYQLQNGQLLGVTSGANSDVPLLNAALKMLSLLSAPCTARLVPHTPAPNRCALRRGRMRTAE
jgi:hypothetical protein